MLLIVGLGNPGEKYQFTRHNIGFMVVDHVFKNEMQAGQKWEFDADMKTHFYKKGDILLAKPQTFMNSSGVAVKKLIDFYKIERPNIWVIHDEIDLPLGKIRIKVGGGSAGHHGIESIIRETGGDDFVRFRLGVGKGKLEETARSSQGLNRHSLEKYVVSNFTTNEEGDVRKLIKHTAKAVDVGLHTGLDRVMNEFNG